MADRRNSFENRSTVLPLLVSSRAWSFPLPVFIDKLFRQLAHERNQLSQRGVFVLLGHQGQILLFKDLQRRSSRQFKVNINLKRIMEGKLTINWLIPTRSDLVVKKLRYYARFIVVCLLLKKMKLVRELVRVSVAHDSIGSLRIWNNLFFSFLFKELSKYVDEYTTTYEPDDQLEWSLVLGEIKSFLEADAILNILDADSNPMVISHRYVPMF